ncbi:MAG: hypothetical protein GY940_29710, partial [bacterium]|nr:hypothetical protein [bacterium]
TFYKVDYLQKEDVMEWLLDLEKYSKIKDYTLSEEDAEKIWNTVGGSMWEIQDILNDLFTTPIDDVLPLYIKKIRSMIAHYVGVDDKKETALRVFLDKSSAGIMDFARAGIAKEDLEPLLRDLVRNNFLYFDPTEALYYPQGTSYHRGIKLFFENPR